VAPRLAIAGFIPLSFLPILFFAFLDKEPLKNQSTTSATDRHDIKYTALEDQDPQKINVLLQVFKVIPFFTYMFIVECSFQLSMTAVLSTLTFPNSPFPPRDHYQYYRLLSDVGFLFLFGGIEIVIVSCLRSEWIEHLKIRKLWVPVSLNVGCLLFFLFASWYRFVPNVYVVSWSALAFAQGLFTSSTCVNCIGRAASLFIKADDKVIAMVSAEVGVSDGTLSSGFLGLFVERYLREHCTNSLLLGRYCLARHSTFSGWSTNSHCKL